MKISYDIMKVRILIPLDKEPEMLSRLDVSIEDLKEAIDKYPKLELPWGNKRIGTIYAKEEFSIFPAKINANKKTGWFNTVTKYYQSVPVYYCGVYNASLKQGRDSWGQFNGRSVNMRGGSDIGNKDALLYVEEGRHGNGLMEPFEVYNEWKDK